MANLEELKIITRARNNDILKFIKNKKDNFVDITLYKAFYQFVSKNKYSYQTIRDFINHSMICSTYLYEVTWNYIVKKIEAGKNIHILYRFYVYLLKNKICFSEFYNEIIDFEYFFSKLYTTKNIIEFIKINKSNVTPKLIVYSFDYKIDNPKRNNWRYMIINNLFLDQRIYILYIDFLKINNINYDDYKKKYFKAKIHKLILDDINWAYMKNVIINGKNREHIIKFIYYLIDTDNYIGDYKFELKINRYTYENHIGLKLKLDLVNEKTKPLDIILAQGNNEIKYFNVFFITDNIYYDLFKVILNVFSNITYYIDVTFLNLINESLTYKNKYYIKSIYDFNDDTFEQQYQFYSNHLNNNQFGSFLLFYSTILNLQGIEYRKINFKKYSVEIFKLINLKNLLLEGYEVVNYSIFDRPIYLKKMLLKNTNEDISSSVETDRIVILDTSFFKNDIIRKIWIDYFWYSNYPFLTRKKTLYTIKEFIVYLEQKYNFEDSLITESKLLDFFSEFNPSNRKKTIIKNFINYCDTKKICKINDRIYKFFSYKENRVSYHKESYSHEELDLLSSLFKKNIMNVSNKYLQFQYTLYYYVFQIYAHTDIRLYSIFNIQISNIKKINDKDYFIKVTAKNAKDNLKSYAITPNVKKIIDEIITITSKVRKVCDEKIKDNLFILIDPNRKLPVALKQNNFSRYMKKLCQKNEVRYLTSEAIRKRRMQDISEYCDNNNLNPTTLSIISGHTAQVHEQYYDTYNINRFCEIYYNSKIGDIELKGTVSKSCNDGKKLRHQSGYCSSNNCENSGNYPCDYCNHFVLTLTDIELLKKEISSLKDKIYYEKIEHEKEHLKTQMDIKVNYLAKLLELRENDKND